LQIAKQTGVQKLFEEGGVKALLKTLEQDLLLLRRQAAMELYNAGSAQGSQWGEPMAAYLLRAAKHISKCKACGQYGHWKNNAICPRRKPKGGKGKSFTKDGG
jgi:recombinational DNA repair protein RecR